MIVIIYLKMFQTKDDEKGIIDLLYISVYRNLIVDRLQAERCNEK